MFSLAKLAFMHLSTVEKSIYYNYAVPIIDVKSCCITLLSNIKSGNSFSQMQYNHVCFEAIENDHMDCMICAQSFANSLNNQKLCVFAAFMEKIRFLKYAFEIGSPWSTKVTLFAGTLGNLDCLKFAHENGCPWHELTCCHTAKFGHLDCLKYAHENNCPWDVNTTESAATNGQLECLIYAFENHCPWDARTIYAATRNSNLECLKYAHVNGCPWDPLKIEDISSISTDRVREYVMDHMLSIS